MVDWSSPSFIGWPITPWPSATGRSPDQIATRFVRLIGKLYRAEALAKDWTPARRLRLRSRYSAAVVRDIERLLLTHLHSVAPSSLLGEALHYLHGQWPKLVRGAWPLDSNPVENAVQPFVVGRRSWLFADTVGGANASANLYSLIESALCRVRHRAVYADRRTMPSGFGMTP